MKSQFSWRIPRASVTFLVLLPLLFSPKLGRAQSLDHFAWSPVPAVVSARQPFDATFEARDSQDRLLTGYSGPVLLSALVPGTNATVLITEVETANTKRVELSNVSSAPVEIGGWRVVFYDSASWRLPRQTFTIPAGTVCPAFGVFQVRASGTFTRALIRTLALGWPSRGTTSLLTTRRQSCS